MLIIIMGVRGAVILAHKFSDGQSGEKRLVIFFDLPADKNFSSATLSLYSAILSDEGFILGLTAKIAPTRLERMAVTDTATTELIALSLASSISKC